MTNREFEEIMLKMKKQLDDIECGIKKNTEAIKQSTAELVRAGVTLSKIEEKIK